MEETGPETKHSQNVSSVNGYISDFVINEGSSNSRIDYSYCNGHDADEKEKSDNDFKVSQGSRKLEYSRCNQRKLDRDKSLNTGSKTDTDCYSTSTETICKSDNNVIAKGSYCQINGCDSENNECSVTVTGAGLANRTDSSLESTSEILGNTSQISKIINLNVKPEELTILSLVSLKLEKLDFNFSRFVSVTEIDLSDNLLSCLPDSFCFFKKCMKLNLSKNKFKVTPHCLFKDLYFIRELDLSHNVIKEFNLSPVCIPYLVDLNVSWNDLATPPMWLIHDIATCLKRLDLSFNPCFNNKLPQIFYETTESNNRICSNISELNVANTGLCPSNVKFLKLFVCLKKLRMSSKDSKLYDCNSLDELPEELLSTAPLEELEAKNCQMSGLPQSIDRATHLRIIRVSNNNFTWLPEKFVHLECLQVFEASYCRLVYLPKEMGLLSSLVELWLSYNDISSLPDMSSCKYLKILDLYSNSFSQMPDTVSSLQLESFDICGNFFKPSSYCQVADGLSYDKLKINLRSKVPSFSRRNDFIKIERKPESCSSSGSSSRSSSYKSWYSFKSSRSRKSNVSSSSYDRRSRENLKDEESWDIDPDEAWDPNLYMEEKRWPSDDGLSRCRALASYTHKENYFCPYQERSNFQQNLYFAYMGEDETGQFDDD